MSKGSDAVKVARIEDAARRRADLAALVKTLGDNPVVELAALVLFLELWYYYKDRFTPTSATALDIDATLLFGAGSTAIIAKQLAPVIPDLLRGGSAAATALTPLLSAAAVIPK